MQGNGSRSTERNWVANFFRITCRGHDYICKIIVRYDSEFDYEINGYCSYVLMPFLNLISEALVVLALLILLIVIQPTATVCIGICLGLTLLEFFKLTT